MITKKEILEILKQSIEVTNHIKILFNPNRYLNKIHSTSYVINLIDTIFFIISLTFLINIPFFFFKTNFLDNSYLKTVTSTLIFPLLYLSVFTVIVYNKGFKFTQNIKYGFLFSLNYSLLIFFPPILCTNLFLVLESYIFYYSIHLFSLFAFVYICVILNISVNRKLLKIILKILVSIAIYVTVNLIFLNIIMRPKFNGSIEVADPILFEFNDKDVLNLSSDEYISNSFEIITKSYEKFSENNDPIYLEIIGKNITALQNKKEIIKEKLKILKFRRNRKWLINSVNRISKIIELNNELTKVLPVDENIDVVISEQVNLLESSSDILNENDIIIKQTENNIKNDLLILDEVKQIIKSMETKTYDNEEDMNADVAYIEAIINDLQISNDSINTDIEHVKEGLTSVKNNHNLVGDNTSKIEHEIFIRNNNIYTNEEINRLYKEILNLQSIRKDNYKDYIDILKMKNFIWFLP